MEPFEASLFRQNEDRPDFGSDTFNLVIRLSIVQQSAFRFSPFCAVLRLLLSFVNLRNLHLFASAPVPNSPKPLFSLQLELLQSTLT